MPEKFSRQIEQTQVSNRQPVEDDPVDLWLSGIGKVNTRTTYEICLRKLMQLMHMDGSRLAQEAESNVGMLWLRAKSTATTKIKSPVERNTALYALRSFLRAIGREAPNTPLEKAHPQKKVYFTWQDAEKLINVAEPPYNIIFRLLRDCAWGITEFLKFNTESSWHAIGTFLQENPTAEYYRHDFDFRKGNPRPYYTLIPAGILREILESKTVLPLGTPRKKPLQLSSYKNSKTYIETAFKRALEKSGFTAPKPFPDNPSPHDFRDAWATQAEDRELAPAAQKFVMGHTVDPLNYNKCYNNEAWMWKQLRKIFAEP